MAKVVAVNTSEKTGIIKNPVSEAVFLEDKGIEGDAHCGLDPIKQVSLLADESVDKMRAMGLELAPGGFCRKPYHSWN